jgi:flavin-dependent dehydrogenase
MSAGLRQYYANVTGFNSDQMIELHFFRELLPGYFWIFPLPDNKANVGLGVLSSHVSRKDLKIKEIFQRIIQEKPAIRDRFAHATALEEVQGFGLPLGSKKRPVSSERVILVGDAAGLIDPFSGEGVGNAIRSGRIAAEILTSAIKEQDFSGKHLHSYDVILEKKIRTELRISRMLQKLANYPLIFDFLLKKAEKNNYVKQYLHDALADVHKRQFTTAPRFLFNLFFR